MLCVLWRTAAPSPEGNGNLFRDAEAFQGSILSPGPSITEESFPPSTKVSAWTLLGPSENLEELGKPLKDPAEVRSSPGSRGQTDGLTAAPAVTSLPDVAELLTKLRPSKKSRSRERDAAYSALNS